MQALRDPPAPPLLKASALGSAAKIGAETASLPVWFLNELALRHFARWGALKLHEVTHHLGLPAPAVEGLLAHMRTLALLEVPSCGSMVFDMSYVLTEVGQHQARLALDKCQYVGPAPVTLPEYAAQVFAQNRRLEPIRAACLKQAMADLVFDPAMLPTLGGALNSGKAIYLYGASGTGKTYLAEHLVKAQEGHIWVPHAIFVDGEVIRVYDPIVHRRVPLAPAVARRLARELSLDGRWVRTLRPVVIAGSELTLEMLSLQHDPHTRMHVAPPQLKANNGIFVVDDLGRQRVSLRELTNRWLVPLDRHVDHLALITGTKFAVPFDVSLVFSSNLTPYELSNPSFVRHLGYKIQLVSLDAEAYRVVVKQACARAKVPHDAVAIDFLVNTLHLRDAQPYLPCLPYNMISKIADRARYLEESARLTPELLEWAWQTYFGTESPVSPYELPIGGN